MNAVENQSKIICIKIHNFTRDALKSICHISVKWNIYYRTFLLPSSAVNQFRKRKLCRLSVNWGLSTKSKRKMQHRLNAKVTTCFIVFGLICSLLFLIVLFAFFVKCGKRNNIEQTNIICPLWLVPFWIVKILCLPKVRM